jgi:biotin synthase-related radical SAM superfamily protein
MQKHLAIPMSLLTNHCVACNKPYTDKIHFRSDEYDRLSKAGKLTEYLGLVVSKS